MTRPQPAVSVVVAARNSAHQFRDLLDALDRQTLTRSQFELIVVDDASDDETGRLAAAAGARIIRCDEHVGLPRARNLGIRNSRADIVAFTDADTCPDPTWLEAGLTRISTSDADILGGGVSIQLGEHPTIAALVDAMNWLNQERCVDQGFALGANFWTRRSTFERWGLFDEAGPAYGHDDAEWGKRATSRGARLAYAPDVHVTHPPRERMAQVRAKAFNLGRALAPHRRPPLNTVAGLPPLFLRPTPYLPPRRLSLARLHELGQYPTALQRVQIYLSQWLFVALPMLVGDFVGEVAFRFGHSRFRAGSAVAAAPEEADRFLSTD